MSSIFREKSLERVSSPEQLDDFVRVITPSFWLVLLAVVILLMGVAAWSIFGKAPVEDGAGGEETMPQISMNIDQNG